MKMNDLRELLRSDRPMATIALPEDVVAQMKHVAPLLCSLARPPASQGGSLPMLGFQVAAGRRPGPVNHLALATQ